MSSATTSTQTTTLCPGCGAKIPTTVSICPYCVTPQKSAVAKVGEEANPVVERLRRMKEKPEYELGLAYKPMEGPQLRAALASGRRGLALVMSGAVLALPALGRISDGRPITIVQLVAGAALVGIGLFRGVRALTLRRQMLAKPLLVRPARVADRRSETEIHGATGLTTYYFELEFDDGSQGEFFYPGRGASEEPLTNGVTGVAYTRGPELLAFKRIRV